MNYKECIKCGKQIPADSRLCKFCGANQITSSSLGRKSLEELGGFLLPIIGFIVMAELTSGASEHGFLAMLGIIVFALGGFYLSFKAMSKLKWTSILVYVWNAVVVVGMFLAVLG